MRKTARFSRYFPLYNGWNPTLDAPQGKNSSEPATSVRGERSAPAGAPSDPTLTPCSDPPRLPLLAYCFSEGRSLPLSPSARAMLGRLIELAEYFVHGVDDRLRLVQLNVVT